MQLPTLTIPPIDADRREENTRNPLATAQRFCAELGGLANLQLVEIIHIIDGEFLVIAYSKEGKG